MFAIRKNTKYIMWRKAVRQWAGDVPTVACAMKVDTLKEGPFHNQTAPAIYALSTNAAYFSVSTMMDLNVLEPLEWIIKALLSNHRVRFRALLDRDCKLQFGKAQNEKVFSDIQIAFHW